MQTVMSRQMHHPLFSGLAGIVGERNVADDDFVLITYSQDISAFNPSIPGIVVRPGSTEEVASIVRLANHTGYPIVLKGGGQAGGGVTDGEPRRNIMLDMGRIDNVDVDMTNLKVSCGAGVRCSRIDDALRPYGYYANTVIGPYFTATIGGLVAGIAGGGFGKYVMTRGCNWKQILGLKVVLPNGDIITTGAGPDTNVNKSGIEFRESTAPDITGLFIGSGGAFGIITEVTMRIYPTAKFMKASSYIIDTMEDTFDIEMKMSVYDPPLYNDMYMFEASSYMVKAMGINTGYATLYFAFEGDDEAEIDSRMKRLDDLIIGEGGHRGNAAMDHYALTGVTGTGAFVHDVCSNACPFMTWEDLHPRRGALEFTKGLFEAFDLVPDHEKYAANASLYVVPCENYMLIGVTLHWDPSIPGADEHMQKTWKVGAEYMCQHGTSSTYAQGSNTRFISRYWSPAYAKFIGGLKEMLDPNHIMCPGLWNL